MKSKTVGIVFGLAAGAAGVVQRPAPFTAARQCLADGTEPGARPRASATPAGEGRSPLPYPYRRTSYPRTTRPARSCAALHPARIGTLPGAARNSRRRPASSARRQCCLLDSCSAGPRRWPAVGNAAIFATRPPPYSAPASRLMDLVSRVLTKSQKKLGTRVWVGQARCSSVADRITARRHNGHNAEVWGAKGVEKGQTTEIFDIKDGLGEWSASS